MTKTFIVGNFNKSESRTDKHLQLQSDITFRSDRLYQEKGIVNNANKSKIIIGGR